MKRILNLIKTELKLVFRDKTFYLWAILLPLGFMIIFGSMQRSSERERVDLFIINRDEGRLSQKFIKYIKAEGLKVRVIKKINPKVKINLVIIPEDFSEKLSKRETATIHVSFRSKKPGKPSYLIKLALYKAGWNLLKEKLIAGKSSVKVISIDTRWFSRQKAVPSGFTFYVPAVIVMFILFNVLFYCGMAVWRMRERGLLPRLAASPLGKDGLWFSLFITGFLVGLIGAAVLFVTGIVFFSATLGHHPFATALVLLIYTASVSALGVLLGSVIKKQELLIGASVLIANLFAALGGCWWPLEIVPDFMKKVAMILPTGWTMDALSKLIFLQLKPLSILPNLTLLLAFLFFVSLLSIIFFRTEL